MPYDLAGTIKGDWINYIPLGLTEREISLVYLYRVLVVNNGNRTRSAKQLGISIRCFRNRMQELEYYGVTVPESRTSARFIRKKTETTE